MYIPIEDVKIQFEKAIDVPMDYSMGGGTICFLVFGLILFIFGLLMYVAEKYKSFADMFWMLPGAFVLTVTTVCYLSAASTEQEKAVNANIAKWKHDYAIPYINTLPTEKRNVVFIKIEASATQEIKDNGLYLRSEEVRRTPLTVSYKDNGEVVTRTDWFGTNMGLSLDEKPYLEYVILPEPLGVREDGKKAEFWAGQYNHQVFLPNDYQFTDIK